METVVCNLCGEISSENLFLVSDYLMEKTEKKIQLVKCSQCGLIYQNPRIQLSEMGEYYPEDYDSYPIPEQIANHGKVLNWFYDYGLKKRCRRVSKFKKSGRLLDVGCATGLFLNAVQKFTSFDVEGVEPNRYAVKLAKDAYNLDIFPGTLEQANFPSKTFDAVTLWDVFEHLHDPAKQLSEIHRILRPEGIVVMRVPNIGSWDAKIFKQYWAGLDAPRHLYVFSRQTMKRMLKKYGFDELETGSFSGSYPVFILNVRFWMSATQLFPKSFQQRLENFLYHPIMRVLSAPFFYLLSLGGKGSMITVVARKI